MADKTYKDFAAGAYDEDKILLQANATTGALTKLLNKDFQLIKKQITTLTNAQVKALPTTAVQIVANPGAGKAILPITALAWFSSWAAAYVASADSSWMLQDLGAQWLTSVAKTQNFLQNGNDDATLNFVCPHLTPGAGTFANAIVTDFFLSKSAWANDALYMQDTYGGVADYTGGNAANVLSVLVFYTIIDIS